MFVLHLVPFPWTLINGRAGDEHTQESKQKRQCISPEKHPEKPPMPQSNKSLLQNEPSNLAPGEIPDQIEFDIEPMKIIFDYMSKEITQLKAEKETYKKQYLAQKEISNSLSTQINDNHFLVTESSMVKELQAEIRGRKRFYNLTVDRRDVTIHNLK
jgi:hypothetical protein